MIASGSLMPCRLANVNGLGWWRSSYNIKILHYVGGMLQVKCDTLIKSYRRIENAAQVAALRHHFTGASPPHGAGCTGDEPADNPLITRTTSKTCNQ